MDTTRAGPATGAHLDPLELLDQVVAAIPAGEDRPQQREMVTEVAAAFARHQHLAVQGPTGVGKSVAYLLPAIARAGRGDRTVVVTSSKALQDQLSRTDLPFLADALDVDFTAAVLKGRSNYLCQAAVAEVRVQLHGSAEQQELELGTADDGPGPAQGLDGPLTSGPLRAELDGLLEWAAATTTGELVDLDDPPSERAWGAVSVGPGECVGAAKCAFAKDCFSEQARARAEDADIVVVNAHLYAAHIQTGGALLPDHTQLVIDEAHEFEDAMVGALGVSLTGWRIRNLARVHDRCVADAPQVAVSLGAAADELDDALAGAYEAAVADHRSGRLHGDLPKDLSGALSTDGTGRGPRPRQPAGRGQGRGRWTGHHRPAPGGARRAQHRGRGRRRGRPPGRPPTRPGPLDRRGPFGPPHPAADPDRHRRAPSGPGPGSGATPARMTAPVTTTGAGAVPTAGPPVTSGSPWSCAPPPWTRARPAGWGWTPGSWPWTRPSTSAPTGCCTCPGCPGPTRTPGPTRWPTRSATS